MIKRLILVLAGLAVIFGIIFGWKYYQNLQKAEQQAGGPPPATVSSAEVARETWQRRIHAVGSIVPTQGVRITNEVAGKVKEIHFRSGAAAGKGDLIVSLDDEVDQAQLEEFIADRDLARAEFARARELLKRGHVSKSDYDSAKARMESAEARVEAQRALIRKKTIRAPFTGQLGIRHVDIGEFLGVGTEIVLLQQLDPVYADFSLPEQHFSEITPGLDVNVMVRAHPGLTFEGHISAVDPGVSRQTRNFNVRATLKNPQTRLRPGMFAEVTVLLAGQQDVLTVPRTAITFNPYGDNVFIIEDNPEGPPTVRRRQIETGATRNGRVEIRKGLNAGDRVVAAGQMKLRNNQPVRINNDVKLEEKAASGS